MEDLRANSQPLYRQIKEELLSQIKNGRLLPGDRLPTEQEFMKKYSVSRITVSKALNELKAAGIVTRYPNRGTFVSASAEAETAASSGAARPEMPTTPTPVYAADAPTPVSAADMPAPAAMAEIACILPSIGDMFSLSVIGGIHSALPEDSYICHIFQSRNSAVENYLLQRCLELNMAGIILFPQDQPFFSDQLLYMQLHKYPLVLIDRYLPRLDTSYVIADNRSAGELCLRHLYNLGHQRVCFASATSGSTYSVKYRIAGVKGASQALGLPETSIRIIERMDLSKKYDYYQELFFRLIRQERFQAFIAAESATSAYLYNLFSFMGLRIPKDVSLISFDKPLVNDQRPDFFTHISQSENLMGREAALILKRQIEQHDTQVYHRMISPKLEICRSTGAAIL